MLWRNSTHCIFHTYLKYVYHGVNTLEFKIGIVNHSKIKIFDKFTLIEWIRYIYTNFTKYLESSIDLMIFVLIHREKTSNHNHVTNRYKVMERKFEYNKGVIWGRNKILDTGMVNL